jgi:hypothetical protein
LRIQLFKEYYMNPQTDFHPFREADAGEALNAVLSLTHASLHYLE